MNKSFSRLYAAQPHYLSGHIVTVEIDISNGLHNFNIVGLPDKAVEEARDRVGSALKNSGFKSPKSANHKIVVSLAPAEIKKEGSFFDLAIALGYLLSTQTIMFDPEGKVFLGELSLNGEIQPLRGILSLVQAAKAAGFSEIYVPADNQHEAALVHDITIYPVKNLRELTQHLLDTEQSPFTLTPTDYHKPTSTRRYTSDFSQVRGQEAVKRGLEIAAAGGHNVAMSGPPGTGKTMLARAFTSILPPLSRETMLEVTGIHSIAGTLAENLITEPPFRSPHHTSSYVSVIGGGATPKPGEITLAHRGVLFLDEFPEFDKRVLESLRQPLEDRVAHISRARGSAVFPADFILVAAMNPCPCGNRGATHKECTCTTSSLNRYQRKLSGPIVDRIDIWLTVEHIDYDKLGSTNEQPGESSAIIQERVHQARKRQSKRLGTTGSNSGMSVDDLQKLAVSTSVRELLNTSAKKLALSPRAYHRTLKLAQTIADLDESDEITEAHILEALQYRPKFSY